VSVRFNSARRLIIVRGDVFGPLGAAVFRMVLDTGLTRTVLDRELFGSIGIVADFYRPVVTMESATGIAHIPQAQADRICSVEQERHRFDVLLHDYSASRFDGVLGLDFLRGHELTIDFPRGQISLT
jgi:Aspartyl protease